jgi:hypothetical protein
MADDLNRDPLSGTPGAHPVGVGVGAAGGAATGAAIGSMGGPVGVAVGVTVGAVAGGLAGKSVAEAIDPTVEDEFWSGNYRDQPYAVEGADYETYKPAYRYGWEAFERYPGRRFDEVDSELQRGWDEHRGDSKLTWNQAREAARDAWHRVERALPGDADDDGL